MSPSAAPLLFVAFAAAVVCLVSLYVGYVNEVSAKGGHQLSLSGSKLPPKAADRHVGHRLHPAKIISKIGDLELSSTWKNDYNVVHIVNSQFLYQQQDLANLEAARLDLFKTFTFPSMFRQSNLQFLWLIWTDPNLPEQLKKEMRSVARAMPNVVVLGAVQDDNLNMRKLYGHEWQSLFKHVVAGDTQLLADYHQASKSHVLLETRLDADDALSESFVDSMQVQAAVAIGRNPDAMPGKMEIFCPESHVEWRYFSPDEDEDLEDDGTLVHYHNRNFCISSGLTAVYNVELPSFLDASATSRNLQGTECRIYDRNIHNCEVTQTYQQCGSSRHLAEVFFGPATKQQQPSSTSLRNDRSRHLQGNILNPGDDKNGVCDNATAIPQPARTFFQTLNVDNPTNCAPGTMACRRLNFTAMTLNVDDQANPDPVYIDGVLTPIDIGVLKREHGYVSECTPVDCSTDRVYLQISAQVGTYGTIQSMAVEIVEQTFSFGGVTFVLDQIELTYGNGTEQIFMSEAAACGVMFTEVSEDGDIAGSNVINLPEEQFREAEQELQRDIQCSNTEMSGVAVCVTPAEYVEPCECVRKLRLLPDENMDGSVAMKPLKASVLMSKTPTAAGMKNVMPESHGGGLNSVKMGTFRTAQVTAWKQMEEQFGVSHKSVAQLRARMDRNMESILLEAFAGQCTAGHSCKESAKRALGKLINKVQLDKYGKA